jgi:hypothetical protein
MTPDYTTLQAIERYYPNTQAVVLLAGEIGVAYTHVIDSSRQANGIDRMKEQFGYKDCRRSSSSTSNKEPPPFTKATIASVSADVNSFDGARRYRMRTPLRLSALIGWAEV